MLHRLQYIIIQSFARICTGEYNISGINFQWTDGLFGLAVSPRRDDGTKTLYFHAFSAVREFSVPTSVVKNESLASADNYYLFKLEGEKGQLTQGTSMAVDLQTGIIYFTQMNRHGIACWNPKVPLSPSTFSEYYIVLKFSFCYPRILEMRIEAIYSIDRNRD